MAISAGWQALVLADPLRGSSSAWI